MAMGPPKLIAETPSSEPYEVRSNHQLAQIRELTQQCGELRRQKAKDLERITHLEAELQEQDERATSAMKAIQEKWKVERKEWVDGCNRWQRLYRIATLDIPRAECDGELERLHLLDTLRLEKIAVAARDFKITAFQAKEQDHDVMFMAMEDEKHLLRKAGDKLRAQCAIYEQDLRDERDQASVLEQETIELKGQLDEMRKSNQELSKDYKSAVLATQALDRIKLELDGSKSSVTELEGQVAELQRINADLKRQLEQWKKLERKGDAEAKAKINLEVEKGELEEQVRDLRKQDKESSKRLKTLKERVTSLEDELSQFQETAQQTQEELDEALAELKRVTLEVTRLENEIKLANHSRKQENEKSPITKKKKSRVHETHGEGEQQIELENIDSPPQPAKVTKSKPKDGSHRSIRKPSQTASSSRPQLPNDAHGDSEDTELEEEIEHSHMKKGKRKKKATSDEEGPGSKDVLKASKKRPREEQVDDGQMPTKKARRKLNAFSEGQPNFNWGSVQDGTLGIPTELSPIKDASSVPKRSMSLLGRLTNHMW